MLWAIAIIGVVALAYVVLERIIVGKLWFWIEAWRQPALAFVLIARDAGWKVCAEDPETLSVRPGWIGPFRMRVEHLHFGVYLDEECADTAVARIYTALVKARKAARLP